jgi:Ca2+-binding EF-hand superfamily protein
MEMEGKGGPQMTAMARIMMFTCAVLLLAGVPQAMALHEYFRSIDVDTDGKVTIKEFSDDMKHHAFEDMDTDKNKSISAEEWKRIQSERDKGKHMKIFESMDKNNDRGISFFEFSNYAERNSNIQEAFMGLDKDRNNSLSPDELNVRPLLKWITIRF